eukprot:TRINITY_DN4351_c0_g1_i4.p1 TRINITY_DN4351_c0_g1~~TRINITY_DN4351_c0_g1_i4.p1  ORF type:complete len:117 (-),score=15.71 TRINITY_DN4351_c0_g1_i4:62-412(-)
MSLNLGCAAVVGLVGVVGYVKTASKPSLAAGATFAILIAMGEILKEGNPHSLWSYFIISCWTLLGSIMGFRYYKGKKISTIVIAIMSILMLVYNFVQLSSETTEEAYNVENIEVVQ